MRPVVELLVKTPLLAEVQTDQEAYSTLPTQPIPRGTSMDTRNAYKPPLSSPNLIQHQQPFIHSYNQQFIRSYNQQFNNSFQPSFKSFTEYLLYITLSICLSSPTAPYIATPN